MDWPLISSFNIATAFFASFCWVGVRVEGGVGGSADGKGITSASY